MECQMKESSVDFLSWRSQKKTEGDCINCGKGGICSRRIIRLPRGLLLVFCEDCYAGLWNVLHGEEHGMMIPIAHTSQLLRSELFKIHPAPAAEGGET